MTPEHGRHVRAVALAPRVRRWRRSRRTPGRAGAAEVGAVVHAVDERGEHVELLRVLVLGDVVLARDRAEDLGGDLVGLVDEAAELLGNFEIDHLLPSLRRARRPPDADGSKVAVPALDGVLLDVAVPAEQLHALGADLDPMLGAQARARERLRGRSSCPCLRGSPPGRSRRLHALELDGDVGDREGDRLAVADRLAERDALVDVGDHVVEHGLAVPMASAHQASRARRTQSA